MDCIYEFNFYYYYPSFGLWIVFVSVDLEILETLDDIKLNVILILICLVENLVV